MRVTVKPSVVGALGIVSKGKSLKDMEMRAVIGNIQTIA